MDEEKKDVTEKASESNDVLDDVKDAQTIISISESDVKENIDDIVDDNSADEADEKIAVVKSFEKENEDISLIKKELINEIKHNWNKKLNSFYETAKIINRIKN